MKSITFSVNAEPIPQGSAKAFVNRKTMRAIVTGDNPRTKPFRRIVTAAAIAAMDCDVPMFGKHVPVCVNLTFTFVRPASARGRQHVVVKPDVDKLTRSVFDALTGCIYADDSQVVTVLSEKRYGESASVKVRVTEL